MIHDNYMSIKERVYELLERDGWDVRSEGSLIRSIIEACSTIVLAYYREAAKLEMRTDPSVAVGTDLEKWCNLFGLTRRNNVYALDVTNDNVHVWINTSFGYIRENFPFVSDELEIPAGLQLFLSDGSILLTMDPIVFSPTVSDVYVNVVSLRLNRSTDIEPRSIIGTNIDNHVPMYPMLKNHINVTNEKVIPVIHDVDTDDDLRSMLFSQMLASTYGTRASIVHAALGVPGVVHAKISDIPRSPHVEELFIIPKTAQLIIPFKMTMRDYLSAFLPAGTTLNIIYPKYKVLSYDLVWRRRPQDTGSADDIKRAIVDYILSIRYGETLDNKVILSLIDGITNRADVTITGKYVGTFDDSFRVKNLVPYGNMLQLGPHELFYSDISLIRISEV